MVAFHFSGHGISEGGHNYLIPSDFKPPEGEQDGPTYLKQNALDAGEVIDRINGAGASLTIGIIDACRDNPLAKSTRSSAKHVGLRG